MMVTPKMSITQDESKGAYVIFTGEEGKIPKPLSPLSVHIKQR
jgi:hypothetical protein